MADVSSFNQRHQEIHLSVEKGGDTAVTLLATETGLSKKMIKLAMQKGAVWLEAAGSDERLRDVEKPAHKLPVTKNKIRRIRRAKKILKQDDILHFYYDEDILAEVPAPAKLISDEGEYSIWYKPGGMRSQGSKWADHCTINRWVEQNLQPQRPAFIVHRLDRAATGLIIIAHQKRMAAVFSELFQCRKIEKNYRVIVYGKCSDSFETLNITTDIDGRNASSHVRVLEYDSENDRSLLQVSIETGRKHQIRRHLSGIGFPVAGDRLYAGDSLLKENLQLTACYLAFECPLKKMPIHFTLPDALTPHL